MIKFLRRAAVLIIALATIPSVVYLCQSILMLNDGKYGKSDCVCLETLVVKELSRSAAERRAAPVVTSTTAHTRLRQVIDVDSCNPNSNQNTIVIFVETAPSHADERQKIRSTWGSVKRHDGIYIRTLFFVGAIENTTLQNSIAMESSIHRDIVQDTSYIDAYRNLTRKSLGALRWVMANCPNPLVVIKVDDDTLVNPYNVVSFLRSASRLTLEKLICMIGYGGQPFRDPTSKWYASYEQFNGTEYPYYCQGMAYIIPAGLVGRLLDATAAVKFLPMEDVYITGLVREFIKVSQYGLDEKRARVSSHSVSEFMKTEWHIKTLLFVGHCKLPLIYDVFWQLVLESRQRQ